MIANRLPVQRSVQLSRCKITSIAGRGKADAATEEAATMQAEATADAAKVKATTA